MKIEVENADAIPLNISEYKAWSHSQITFSNFVAITSNMQLQTLTDSKASAKSLLSDWESLILITSFTL